MDYRFRFERTLGNPREVKRFIGACSTLGVKQLGSAVIFHSNLNELGGSERVCLGFVEAAKSLGLRTQLVTMVPPNWDLVKSVFGPLTFPDECASVYLNQPRLEKFLRLRMSPLGRVRNENTTTVNTAGYRWLPVSTNLVYEHTPPVNVPGHSRSGLRLAARMYYGFFDIQQILRLKSGGTTVLTNSNYCASVIRSLRIAASVLPPPVDVGEFDSSSIGRRNSVVTCGRFEPQKNYEFIVEVASMLPGVQFTILGAVTTSRSVVYFKKLTCLLEEMSIKNVELLKNAPRQKQIDEYEHAKVYLHAMIGEDFGIAIVEGMAAGLIPVLHKSGGAWKDIAEGGKFGYGYLNATEAAKGIEAGIKASDSLRALMRRRAGEFSREKFKIRASTFLMGPMRYEQHD
jgi:alpha-1,2-mannosyltransferase